MSQDSALQHVENGREIERYAFVFVCQSGALECQAALLAASLERYVKVGGELIAVVPTPVQYMGEPAAQTLDFLEKLGVNIVQRENTIVDEQHQQKIHYMANKFLCLEVPTSADKLVFLDSDTMFRGEFHGDPRYQVPMNIRIVGMQGAMWTFDRWRRLYDAAGVEMPNARLRVPANRDDQPRDVFIPPYFNTGFVAVHTGLAKTLCDAWMDVYRTILDSGILHDNPDHIEQISLPIAIHKANIAYETLTIEEHSEFFVHYFEPMNVEKRPPLQKLAASLVRDHPELKTILRIDERWKFLY